jgi:adenylylsulfate kinase-like enzyme
LIINITGQAGSGKTTIARELEKMIKKPIVIDGDELREIFVNKDYSEEGRRKNITNAYNIARFLEAKGFIPIIALISPYSDLREELKSQSTVSEIYLTTSQIRGRENFFAPGYLPPQEDFLHINTDNSLDDCLEQILIYTIEKNGKKG